MGDLLIRSSYLETIWDVIWSIPNVTKMSLEEDSSAECSLRFIGVLTGGILSQKPLFDQIKHLGTKHLKLSQEATSWEWCLFGWLGGSILRHDPFRVIFHNILVSYAQEICNSWCTSLMFTSVLPGGIAYQESVLHQQGCCPAPHQFGGLCKEWTRHCEFWTGADSKSSQPFDKSKFISSWRQQNFITFWS